MVEVTIMLELELDIIQMIAIWAFVAAINFIPFMFMEQNTETLSQLHLTEYRTVFPLHCSD